MCFIWWPEVALSVNARIYLHYGTECMNPITGLALNLPYVIPHIRTDSQIMSSSLNLKSCRRSYVCIELQPDKHMTASITRLNFRLWRKPVWLEMATQFGDVASSSQRVMSDANCQLACQIQSCRRTNDTMSKYVTAQQCEGHTMLIAELCTRLRKITQSLGCVNSLLEAIAHGCFLYKKVLIWRLRERQCVSQSNPVKTRYRSSTVLLKKEIVLKAYFFQVPNLWRIE